MELRDIPVATIVRVIEAMARLDGMTFGAGFSDYHFDPPVHLSVADCQMIWRQRLNPDGSPRFTQAKAESTFTEHDYDPLE